MQKRTINFEQIEPTFRNADIVFCIDATGSMEPCFSGIKNNLTDFIAGLNSNGAVDWRFKLLAYRDKHSDPLCLWQDFPFTASADEFKANLNLVTPSGGEDEEESTLDALYMATKSDWRKDSSLQRVIVLITDADSHKSLHPSTYNLPDNNIERVAQEFQDLKHSMLFMVAPDVEIYNELDKRLQLADKKVYFDPQEVDEKNTSVAKYKGLSNVDFKSMLTLISKSISGSY
jgi:hypothetical protein